MNSKTLLLEMERSMTVELTKSQADVLREVTEQPGITFGLGKRKAGLARKLQAAGLIEWRSSAMTPGVIYTGWYPVRPCRCETRHDSSGQ